MNWRFALVGCVMILLAGFVGADSISSVIVVDGAAWVSSSVLDQGQTYTGRLFTTDLAILMRDLVIDQTRNLKTSTNVKSTGPVGIDEYSVQLTNSTDDENYCVFESVVTPVRKDQILYTGLMQNGEYISNRDLNQDTTAVTMINGTGLMLARANSFDGNRSTTHASTVGGTMNLTERIRFGED